MQTILVKKQITFKFDLSVNSCTGYNNNTKLGKYLIFYIIIISKLIYEYFIKALLDQN